jgi:hypothetical protein
MTVLVGTGEGALARGLWIGLSSLGQEALDVLDELQSTALYLPGQSTQVTKIRTIDQNGLDDGIDALRSWYDAVFVPAAFLEQLPVLGLHLLVVPGQPSLESERLMNEDDRNLQFATPQ